MVTFREDGESTVDSLLASVARAPVIALPLPEGTTIDETYRVERTLGSGGMAVVYLARDVRLNRAVALKLHGTVEPASAERALREAKAMARLSHPNVVTVHEVGTYEERVFIAMEFVDGGTMRDWLARRPRRWREVLDMFVKAARGLAAAHDAGLVHRDFKPDNILVGTDGRVRVGDFGLARDSVDPALERGLPDGRAGTPAYMSPEQRRGEAVAASSDQYSFCVSLREALIRSGGAPRWLSGVLARGLADAPAHRWPSMHALLSRVEEHRRRHRMMVVAGAVGVVAILGSILGWRLRAPAPPAGAHRWLGDWGELYLRTDADGVTRGVYTHDQGAVVGRIERETFRGWWCEEPTRMPPHDAGYIEFAFVRDGGLQRIDGRWRYGDGPRWDGDWRFSWLEGSPDRALAARLEDASQACPPP